MQKIIDALRLLEAAVNTNRQHINNYDKRMDEFDGEGVEFSGDVKLTLDEPDYNGPISYDQSAIDDMQKEIDAAEKESYLWGIKWAYLRTEILHRFGANGETVDIQAVAGHIVYGFMPKAEALTLPDEIKP